MTAAIARMVARRIDQSGLLAAGEVAQTYWDRVRSAWVVEIWTGHTHATLRQVAVITEPEEWTALASDRYVARQVSR